MQSRVYTHGRPGSPSMHRYRSAAGETLHAAGSLKTSADHHPDLAVRAVCWELLRRL